MDRVTTFLKDFPDKWLITLVLMVVLVSYLATMDAFLQRLVDMFAGAVIALLVRGFVPKKDIETAGHDQGETSSKIELNIENQN